MIVVLIKAKTKLWSHSRLYDIHNSTFVIINTVNAECIFIFIYCLQKFSGIMSFILFIYFVCVLLLFFVIVLSCLFSFFYYFLH